MTVLDQAQNIGGIVSAARARERWQQQMAKTSNEERREQLREAIADLEMRFPELEDVPPGGAEAFARGRGHGTRSRSPVRHGRQRLQASKVPDRKKSTRGGLGTDSKAAKGRKPVPGLDPGAQRTRAQRAAAKGRPTPRVDRAIRQTGIPGAVEGGTSATMLLLGATVSLSLLYLVLSSAEKPGTGAAALPSVVHGLVAGIGRFLAPQDFFGPAPEATAPKLPLTPSKQGNRGAGGSHITVPFRRGALGNRGIPGATVVPYRRGKGP